MSTESIFQIVASHEPRAFTLQEAETLFPMVRRLTQCSYAELDPVRRQLESLLPTSTAIIEVEEQYEAIVKRWVGKMERLGLVVKGLWLVDFDTGDGYLCWKFPELKLSHYHSYEDGYAERRPIGEVVEELDPDWARA